MDLKSLTEQKRQIKDFYAEQPAKAEEEQKQEDHEVLDESIVSRNSSCILVGAYLRKYAVSPKNFNLHEFDFLLNTYKALFKVQ